MIDRRLFLASAGGNGAGALAPAFAAAARRPWPLPPQHARVPADVGNLGYHRMDDYAWFQPKDWHAVLRAPDSLDAPIKAVVQAENAYTCLLYTSPSPRDRQKSRMPSSA